MWQRFTERARKVIWFAQEEAGRFGENQVATEHLLLGLVREEDHVAARILKQLGVDLQHLRDEVERQLASVKGRSGQGMELTPNSKRTIDLAYDEAKALDNNYIGTEHLLLGLIRDNDGLAGRVLLSLGVDLEEARAAVRRIQAEATGKSEATDSSVVQRAKESLNALADRLTGRSQTDVMPVEENIEPTPGRGHIGVLRNDNERKHIEFVPHAEDLPAFAEVMVLKDEFAYRDLVTEGKILLLAAGTGAKFLRAERLDIYCVRILDGDHAGAIGFVLRQQLKDTRADDRPFPPEIL